ncbi:MAG: anti-sigma factor [Rhodanobacteraceae bacterium]
MNTPIDHEPEDPRYAEYVLGVLDADARGAVERELASDPKAAAEVERWQRYLVPLAEDIAPVAPSENVWIRLQKTLEARTQQQIATREQRGVWNSLAFWRLLAFSAGAIAAACIIALIVVPRWRVTPPSVAYMASTITQTNGQVGWTATMDLQHARMIIVPAKPQNLPAGRAPELWLIPAGQKPIAVGMIDRSAPTTIPLARTLLARLGPTAALAVSVEPSGGSPTGQPTGPVIAKGTIGAAPSASGNKVAMLYAPSDSVQRGS